jgi:methionyl aminopeptidase
MRIIIKNERQIEGIRKSCKLAAKILDFAGDLIANNTDLSLGEMDRKIEEEIRAHGATPAPLNYLGYPRSSCFSINEVVCHGIPRDDQHLQDGDIVNVDITTILGGYFGDTSRMFSVGEISDEAAEIMSVARTCLELGIAQVKPGNQLGNIGKAITEYATSKGCSVVYQFCGHGTGLKFHEEPQINHLHTIKGFDTRRMAPGMVFTIEPMINQGLAEAVIDKQDGWTARTSDGKLSAQYEHTVLVTEKGVEILT